MVKLSKLVAAAAIAARVVAAPALAQSFDPDAGTGNVLPFSFAPFAAKHEQMAVHQAGRRAVAARRSGTSAFARVPDGGVGQSANDPALTGGGSLGYNQMLLQY